MNKSRRIPQKSLILPETIPLIIPDFKNHCENYVPLTLAFDKVDSEKWFFNFVDTVVSKIGKEFFPIMRLSDGEYTLLLGFHYPYVLGHSFKKYFNKVVVTAKNKLFKKKYFNAATLPGVSSGNYNISEIEREQKRIVDQIRVIAKNGVLALHLTYPLRPFQEHFHLPLKIWLNKNNIELNRKNYYPFYFVYALLRGSHRSKIFAGKKILVLHSATGTKRDNIISALKSEGVEEVIWYGISTNRSLFDKIELQKKFYSAELALVGAGVGKFNIITQLESLKIPCIDAGFVFEVWADDENKWKRPMMVPDWDWDREKMLFLR